MCDGQTLICRFEWQLDYSGSLFKRAPMTSHCLWSLKVERALLYFLCHKFSAVLWAQFRLRGWEFRWHALFAKSLADNLVWLNLSMTVWNANPVTLAPSFTAVSLLTLSWIEWSWFQMLSSFECTVSVSMSLNCKNFHFLAQILIFSPCYRCELA